VPVTVDSTIDVKEVKDTFEDVVEAAAEVGVLEGAVDVVEVDKFDD
jgi:hypothetical protein